MWIREGWRKGKGRSGVRGRKRIQKKVMKEREKENMKRTWKEDKEREGGRWKRMNDGKERKEE